MTLTITESGNAMTGVLNGRLDTAAATQLAKEIQPLLDHADGNIILDCTDLEFISSSGLRLLLTIHKASKAKGGTVTLKGVSENVMEVLKITSFSSLFQFA